LTFECEYVQLNRMRSRQLHDALEKLTKAIREVEAVVETIRTEHDPLASHIFVSRRHYQNLSDTKTREAPRNECTAEFQHSLRAGLSREFGRMGAVDGCGGEATTLTKRKRRPEYAVWKFIR
jgi:hypothetical protein